MNASARSDHGSPHSDCASEPIDYDLAPELRSLRQRASLDPGCRCPCSHAVLRSGGSQGARLGGRVLRDGRRDPPGEPGVRHAGDARCRRGGARLDLRDASHRVDHHRVDISVQHRGRDRSVPDHERLDRRFIWRQAPAAHPDRVLLRRVPRGHGRRRRSCRHHRCIPDWARLQSVSGGSALPRGQYRAGGLGRYRQSDPDAGRRDRTAGDAVQRDDGTHSAAARVHPAALAGSKYGRLEANVRGVAGALRERLLLRPHAVPTGRTTRRSVWSTSCRRFSRCSRRSLC